MKHWLEQAFNRYLALDSESARRISALQNKVVTIELLGISLTVQLVFTKDSIQFKWDHFDKADLIIRGTPLNLLHMRMARDQRQRFFAEDIVIEGNMELAHQVLAIFDDLEIDWEEYLSKWIGDAPAYQSGRLLSRLKKTSQKIRKTFLYNLNEYLHEEINIFPPAEALHYFFHEIDELRMDVDRLEARIKKLKDNL